MRAARLKCRSVYRHFVAFERTLCAAERKFCAPTLSFFIVLPSKAPSCRVARLLHTSETVMNTSFQKGQEMNTTILSYPGFQTLPKGIKQMLLASEAHFFDQPVSHATENKRPARAIRTGRDLTILWGSFLPTPA
jgi:hypothetical protein